MAEPALQGARRAARGAAKKREQELCDLRCSAFLNPMHRFLLRAQKSQADARARALIELQMLLNFWGAAADGMPESDIAGVCYEVAMGDVELDQGPMNIIMSYLHKEDREN